MKNVFKSIFTFFFGFFKKAEKKQVETTISTEKELTDLIKERDILNKIILEKQELDRITASKAILKRSLELMKYEQTSVEDKLKFQNEELAKARQDLSNVKISAPLIVEPDEIVGHNENIIPTNPSLDDLKNLETDSITKQLKAQCSRKNRVEKLIREAKEGGQIQIITSGE